MFIKNKGEWVRLGLPSAFKLGFNFATWYYKTTDDFLDYFGLSTKEDLPDISQIEVTDQEKDLFRSNYHDEKE